jgi:death on curing protein
VRRRRWLTARDVIAIHAEQIAQHGGKQGIRDIALLESAIARPRNKAHYGRATAFEIAAAYAYGIARKNPFFDGNKRVALISAFLFLELNGWRVEAAEEDAVIAFLALAAGELSERRLAEWLKTNSRRAGTK